MVPESNTLVEKLLQIESDSRTRLSALSHESFEEEAIELSLEIGPYFLNQLFDLISAAEISLWARTIDVGKNDEKNILKPFLGQKFPDGEYYRHVTTVFNPAPELFYANYSSGQDIETLKRLRILNNESTLGWKGKTKDEFENLMFGLREEPITGYPNDWVKRGDKTLSESTLIEYRRYIKAQYDIDQGITELPFETYHSSVVFPIKDADGKTFYLLRFEGIKPPKSNPMPEGLKDLMELAMEYRGEFLRRIKERTAPLLTREQAEAYVAEKQAARLFPEDFEITDEFMREDAYRILPRLEVNPHISTVYAELEKELLEKHGREAFDGLPMPTKDEIQLLVQFFDYDEPVTQEQLRQLGYVALVLEGIVNSYSKHDELVRTMQREEQLAKEKVQLTAQLSRARTWEVMSQLAGAFRHTLNSPLKSLDTNIGYIQGTDIVSLVETIDTVFGEDPKSSSAKLSFYQLLHDAEEAARQYEGSPSRDIVRELKSELRAANSDLSGYAKLFTILGYSSADVVAFSQQYGDKVGSLADVLERVVETTSALNSSQQSVDHMSEKVNQLRLKEGEFSLEEAVKSAGLIIASTGQEKVSINGNYQSELPTLYGTPILLVEAVLNLFNNAIEAGATEIDVDTYSANDYLGLRVKDNGPGLPESIRDKVFKQELPSEKEEGAGLGLKIVYDNIVNQLGGKINFDTSSRGTVYEILIPYDTNTN